MMTLKQKYVIKYAFTDLCGSLQAWDQSDNQDSIHDWDGHCLTILDLVNNFPSLDLIIPDNIHHLVFA